MIKEKLHCGPVFVKRSAIHGYGVFAASDIAAGEIVEECHTILTSATDSAFKDYYFKSNEQSGIPLGYGSIYNHSNTPNVEYVYHEDTGLIVFTAIKPIRRGDEICSSYGKDWFGYRNMRVKKIAWWRRLYRFTKKAPLRATIVLLSLWGFMQALNYFVS